MVNWAWAGLGLPLTDEVRSPESEPQNSSDFYDWYSFNASSSYVLEDIDSTHTAPVFYNQVPCSPPPPQKSWAARIWLYIWVALRPCHMSHGSYMTQGVMTAQQDSMELVMSTNTALGWLANSTAQDKGWLQEAATDSATATGLLLLLGCWASWDSLPWLGCSRQWSPIWSHSWTLTSM